MEVEVEVEIEVGAEVLEVGVVAEDTSWGL